MRESGFLLRRCIAAGYAPPSLWKLKAAMTAKAAGIPCGREPWSSAIHSLFWCFLKGSAIGNVVALSPQYSESTAFLRFSVGGLHGWGLLSVIHLELQEKSINHFLWHGLLKQFSWCFTCYGVTPVGNVDALSRLFVLRAACFPEGAPYRKRKAAPTGSRGRLGSRAMAFGLFERGVSVLLHLIEEVQLRAVYAILLLPQGKFMQERDRAR